MNLTKDEWYFIWDALDIAAENGRKYPDLIPKVIEHIQSLPNPS